MATKFPNAIDNFPTMLDITSDDAPLVKEYAQYMEDGNYELAQATLSQIENGQNKIITAGLFNDMLDSLEAVEKYFQARYSPGYIVARERPIAQEANDFWFEITNEVS